MYPVFSHRMSLRVYNPYTRRTRLVPARGGHHACIKYTGRHVIFHIYQASRDITCKIPEARLLAALLVSRAASRKPSIQRDYEGKYTTWNIPTHGFRQATNAAIKAFRATLNQHAHEEK